MRARGVRVRARGARGACRYKAPARWHSRDTRMHAPMSTANQTGAVPVNTARVLGLLSSADVTFVDTRAGLDTYPATPFCVQVGDERNQPGTADAVTAGPVGAIDPLPVGTRKSRPFGANIEPAGSTTPTVVCMPPGGRSEMRQRGEECTSAVELAHLHNRRVGGWRVSRQRSGTRFLRQRKRPLHQVRIPLHAPAVLVRSGTTHTGASGGGGGNVHAPPSGQAAGRWPPPAGRMRKRSLAIFAPARRPPHHPNVRANIAAPRHPRACTRESATNHRAGLC